MRKLGSGFAAGLLIALCALLTLLFPSPAPAATLDWTDLSTNELGFSIERKPGECGAAGTWTEIATVGANVVTYLDATTQVGYQYCYRLRAWNRQYLDGSGNIQYSPYSNEAGVGYPLGAPAGAGQLRARQEQ